MFWSAISKWYRGGADEETAVSIITTKGGRRKINNGLTKVLQIHIKQSYSPEYVKRRSRLYMQLFANLLNVYPK